MLYVLSFIKIGTYWNNHHHLLQAIQHVNGRILWANLHLLFWLSLVPFGIAWAGGSHFSTVSVAMYGVILFFAGLAYWILTQTLITSHGKDSTIAIAIGKDYKGVLLLALYGSAIPLAFIKVWLACSLYVLVAVM